ncbi:DUF4335 domain-containing protein [Chlorogloea sp. CCALA 695]|uniref:DUF4335 domain-containing protein n=1 Tax=Chlorogloea sp. CCALA 695 TaxID=2107693 RepID=UPI000D07228B|nr:DUF4335 domain-containing protein [Chlorogloea sp. CCALA 695]PSB33123.1 hypothetical protein C7B70_07565 [Chlorogloea sp. CCALA 695]
MSLSNSVLHRYTPPTCTLQVVAYSSPVSRWVGSKVVKEVQFDLRFDDPRSPSEKQFSITGDRQQLESLHTVVTDYIQELLTLSPESFAALGQETLSPPVDVESDVWLLPAEDLPPNPAKGDRLIAQSNSFAIKPASKVAHNLFLGALATPQTGELVKLSVLQLFDLATALDEYKNDLIALPTLARHSQTSPLLAWANIAAVLLLGVGVTAVGLQVFNRPNPQTANNINNRPKTTPNPQVALVPSPPSLSPATTILVPSPNSSIPATGAVSTPSTAPVPQTVRPGTKINPVANGLPPQPIVINPPAAQTTTTTTTVTVPGATNRTTPPIAILPSPNLSSSATPSPSTTTTTVKVQQDSNSREAPTPPKPTTTATRTAFVANPQVAEVSNYFNGRWEPPSNLRSSLEYSIVLDVDGSIQVIEPYGLASRTYLDRTGMPLIGERFVSANQNGQSPRIRLRFNPNGKVQAFLEAGDAR